MARTANRGVSLVAQGQMRVRRPGSDAKPVTIAKAGMLAVVITKFTHDYIPAAVSNVSAPIKCSS